jgi:hypothetical protein
MTDKVLSTHFSNYSDWEGIVCKSLWQNGSPRLTAYEYQGVLRSECFIKGEPGKQNQIAHLSFNA